jgi:hypothetical protein
MHNPELSRFSFFDKLQQHTSLFLRPPTHIAPTHAEKLGIVKLTPMPYGSFRTALQPSQSARPETDQIISAAV